MALCEINWNNPDSWDNCKTSAEEYYIILEHDKEKQRPYCYDAYAYEKGGMKGACFDDPHKLADELENSFKVDFIDFRR